MKSIEVSFVSENREYTALIDLFENQHGYADSYEVEELYYLDNEGESITVSEKPFMCEIEQAIEKQIGYMPTSETADYAGYESYSQAIMSSM